jgi:hypothetical protein
MRAPSGKGGALLIGPVVPLVDADNAGAASGDMVEDGFCDCSQVSNASTTARSPSRSLREITIAK